MSYIGEVALVAGAGNYLGEVSLSGGIPAGSITGLTPTEVLYGDALGGIGQNPAFTFDDTFSILAIVGGIGAFPGIAVINNDPVGLAAINVYDLTDNFAGFGLGLSALQSAGIELFDPLATSRANFYTDNCLLGMNLELRGTTPVLNFSNGVAAPFATLTKATGDFRLVTGAYRTGASQALGAEFFSTLNPPSPLFAAGATVILATVLPAAGYRTLVPQNWTIPARAVATVTPAVRINFSDGTFFISSNTTAAPLQLLRCLSNFAKNGVRISSIEFQVTNTGAATSVDFGAWSVEGEQY